jgi:glutaredoxin
MKKVIVLLLICAAAYWGYTKYGSTLFGSGAFDEQGRAKVVLFTMDSCGQPCADVAADLRNRNVAFEEVSVSTDEGRSRIEKYGATQVPFTVIGNDKVVGSDLPALEAALGEAYGMEVLTPAVQQVMRGHFDESGKPRVVMYGTDTCPHCKRLKAYLDERKVVYQFVDIAGFGSGRAEYDTLRGRGYPLTFVGYRRIDGYDEKKINLAVKDLL